MIKIFKEKTKEPIITLHFIVSNLYTLIYSIDIDKKDNVLITFFVNSIYQKYSLLSEYEILFDKNIKRTIRRFLKLPTNKLIINLLDDSNRSFLTLVKNRSDLENIIGSIKRELRRIVNGSI